MGEGPPQGRGQAPFRRGTAPTAEDETLLEGGRRSNMMKHENLVSREKGEHLSLKSHGKVNCALLINYSKIHILHWL
jgi:hypothetical protein